MSSSWPLPKTQTLDCSAGAEFNLQKGDRLESVFPSKPLIMQETYLRCLSLYAAARKSKGGLRRRYKKAASRVMGKISNWVEQGNPNVRHYESLLEGEKSALKGKIYLAKRNYEYAITMAARNGFLNDTALAHLRYGEFLISDCAETEDGVYHLRQAVVKFREWGAYAVSDSIIKRYSDAEERY